MTQPKDTEFQGKDTMTLDLDDGSTIECIVVSVFECEGKQYIALLPMNEDGHVEDDAQVFMYRFKDLGNDDIQLDNIEDDEEFERVSDAFDEMLDEAEFEELFS